MLSESTKIKYAAAFFSQRLFTIQSRLRHTRLRRAHVGQFTLCMIYDEASVSSSALAYSVYELLHRLERGNRIISKKKNHDTNCFCTHICCPQCEA